MRGNLEHPMGGGRLIPKLTSVSVCDNAMQKLVLVNSCLICMHMLAMHASLYLHI